MGEETMNLMAAFTSSLLDASGQPNLITSSPQPQKLIWTLGNNQRNEDLVVIPFGSGRVDQNQYHFRFDFVPGALANAPTLQGWDTHMLKDDKHGIKTLFVALSGSTPLTIKPGVPYTTPLTYTDAIQEDNRTKVAVSLTTGGQVTLGGNPIPGTPIGPFHLTLVKANTPTLSAPPLAVDFVGRRTVLNDGRTSNSFTFALTNMTQADIPLTPEVAFTVWFDAAPNESTEGYPWALARVQDLTSAEVNFHTPTGWTHTNPITKAGGTVSPQWKFNVSGPLVLKPQDPDPVLFKFCGIKTDLDPGVTRMYLRFENLPGFTPGVLIAELEKTPLLYGPTRGQGLYLSVRTPPANTPAAPNYDGGLSVRRLGGGPAAVFNGGSVGIGTEATPPAAKLHIVDANQQPDGGTLILGSGNPEDPSLRFGCQPGYAWVQSHAGKPLVLNPLPRNVGVGTTVPGSSLSVNGGVAIGSSYAQNTTTIAANNLAVEGKVGIGTTAPGSSLSVAGGVAIGRSYAQTNTTIAANDLAVEGSVGIGTPTPGSKLHVVSSNGIRLSLAGSGGGQLFLSNGNNDKSVQLVAIGPNDTPQNPVESAAMMYLGGWAAPHPQLPKMVLNAKEVAIQAATTVVNGKVGIGGAADSQAPLLVHGGVKLNAGDLTVDGSVMMGAGGRLPAACGTEKLMIVRGVIWGVNTSNGLTYKITGQGFTVQVGNDAGVWIILFDPPFTDMPSVVTTPQFFGQETAHRIYNTCFVTYTSKTSIRIRTGDVYYGNPNWNDFSFIAIGPR